MRELFNKLISPFGLELEMIWDWKGETQWSNHFGNKVYLSEKSAIDAINQMRLSGVYLKTNKFRVIPLYRVEKSYFRNITINKILK
jgi:hypothetical protein